MIIIGMKRKKDFYESKKQQIKQKKVKEEKGLEAFSEYIVYITRQEKTCFNIKH